MKEPAQVLVDSASANSNEALTEVFVPLLRCFQHLGILSFPIICEPARDLLPVQASLLRQQLFVRWLHIRALDVVQKPFL